MLPKHAPCGVENRTRAQCVRMEPRHHVGIGAPWDKADFLAVRFVSYRKLELPRLFGHLPLGILADLKPHPAQLRLVKTEKNKGIDHDMDAHLKHNVHTAHRI